MKMNIIATRSKKGSDDSSTFTFDIVKVSLYKIAVSLCLLRMRDLRSVCPVIHEIWCYGGNRRFRIIFVEIIFSAIILFAFHVSFWFQNDRGVNMQYSVFFSCRVLVTFCRYMAEILPIMRKTSNQSINLEVSLPVKTCVACLLLFL